MKLMQYNRIPRKYHLSWNQKLKLFTIQVSKECVRATRNVPSNSPWVRSVALTHDVDGLFDAFSGDLSADTFGFNGIVRRTRETDSYAEYCAAIPRVMIETNAVCEECGGNGKRNESGFNDRCLYCDGSGKRRIRDWRTAYLTTASLNLLFQVIEICDVGSVEDCQHATIQMMSEYGQHGSSLGGCFGVDLCGFLRNDLPEKIDVLENAFRAMSSAYNRMVTLRPYDRHSFSASADNGFLILSCPGDACGVSMTDHCVSIGRGCEFSCHNVDSPVQSLSLLAGIASIVGQADRLMRSREEKLVAV